MTEDILRPSRWKAYVACLVGFVAASPLVLRFFEAPSSKISRQDLGGIMLSFSALAYAYFSSGRYLRFRREAFEVKERFGDSSYTLWSDVERIGIATFPSTAGGKLSYRYFAGVRLRDSALREHHTTTRANRDACGYDILLEPHYGLSLEHFVTFLNDKKRESEKG